MFSLSMFGPFRCSVFRCSVLFDVQSFDVRSHSRFGLLKFSLLTFGPIRRSVSRCSVPFEVRSFDVRSCSTFGLSRFGLSTFSLSRFGLSRIGHSRFGHGFDAKNNLSLWNAILTVLVRRRVSSHNILTVEGSPIKLSSCLLLFECLADLLARQRVQWCLRIPRTSVLRKQ
jgi:hypothetical protein